MLPHYPVYGVLHLLELELDLRGVREPLLGRQVGHQIVRLVQPRLRGHTGRRESGWACQSWTLQALVSDGAGCKLWQPAFSYAERPTRFAYSIS